MSFRDSFMVNLESTDESNFEQKSLDLFNYQYKTNRVYNEYCNYLNKTPKNVKKLYEVPFLPISFYKNHIVKSGEWKEEYVFKSSGTTESGKSNHFIREITYYLNISFKIFSSHFPDISNYILYGLVPSYQEQGNSSLIYMIDHIMKYSEPNSGYFLNQDDELHNSLLANNDKNKILFGVSYALLDFASKYPEEYKNLIIIETGGMKGRKKEMTRDELHENLLKGFKSNTEILSEYGMSELTSQAYSLQGGAFSPPNWMKVLIRDINDPFSLLQVGRTGGINIIDLANIDSCAFIETMDLGKLIDNQMFNVLGRYDNSDIRGCNLLLNI